MNRSISSLLAAIGVLSIITAIIIGPFFTHPYYYWISHSISELAGQRMPYAWIMRTGFVLFGTTVLIASLLRFRARPAPSMALIIFGLGMIASAIWSHAFIDASFPSNEHEDMLHSIASSVAGIGFVLACASSIFAPSGNRSDWLAWTGLVVSVVIPLAMIGLPEFAGILQRAMFLVSFVYVLREFVFFDPDTLSN